MGQVQIMGKSYSGLRTKGPTESLWKNNNNKGKSIPRFIPKKTNKLQRLQRELAKSGTGARVGVVKQPVR